MRVESGEAKRRKGGREEGTIMKEMGEGRFKPPDI